MSEDLDKFAECANCGHFPAWHRENADGRICGAWTDKTDDCKCACPGWKDKVAIAVQQPWGWERKDLQG